MLKNLWGLAGKCSQIAYKSLTRTLMSPLTMMKFNDSGTMYEPAIDMTNIAARLKTLGMVVNENFFV